MLSPGRVYPDCGATILDRVTLLSLIGRLLLLFLGLLLRLLVSGLRLAEKLSCNAVPSPPPLSASRPRISNDSQ